ncbi:MAG: MerR family transcriptional regulator [Gammaproteobacteria bacterium TMED180]|nr:MAG: MerR family transcriptional regulator [Gammaproteobacteria bacterium TMED180]|tara:strand:- start:601 stop:957 length:357 start_codon:yes stop_codon:yes gene_type:complete
MLDQKNNNDLPPIPGKRYFSIGEVSTLCLVKPHVLRYWEQEFLQLNPLKRKGNRRYYQREDLVTIRLIRSLLYEQGYTAEGARQQLNGEKTKKNKTRYNQLINQTLSELDEILLILKD